MKKLTNFDISFRLRFASEEKYELADFIKEVQQRLGDLGQYMSITDASKEPPRKFETIANPKEN